VSIITTTEPLSAFLITISLFLRKLFSVNFSSIVKFGFSRRTFSSSISFVKLFMHSIKSGSVPLSGGTQFDLDIKLFSGLVSSRNP
jgi:hypothetical protein